MSPYPVKLAMLAILTLALAVALATGQQPQPQISPAQSKGQAEKPPHVDEQTNPEARALEKSITDALSQDPHMAYSSVSVHAVGDEIVLTGTVLTSAAKDQAEKIATEHAAGKTVTNKIRVNPNIHPGPGL
jgi:osmotically-inducible protein OsmY